jgi:peptide/nickel transport system permease protein
MNGIRRMRPGAVSGYLAAALAMIYLSYVLPGLLPGDFVTAMYGSSHVTLSAAQEAELKSFYSGRDSFGRYFLNVLSMN